MGKHLCYSQPSISSASHRYILGGQHCGARRMQCLQAGGGGGLAAEEFKSNATSPEDWYRDNYAHAVHECRDKPAKERDQCVGAASFFLLNIEHKTPEERIAILEHEVEGLKQWIIQRERR